MIIAFYRDKWLLLIALFLFIGLSADSNYYIETIYKTSPTIYEVILEQTNESNKILISLTFIMLLLSSNNDTNENIIGLKKYDLAFKGIKNTLIISLIFLILFLIANIFVSLYTHRLDGVFINKWTYLSALSDLGLDPVVTVSISLLLIFLRFSFNLYLLYFINTITQNKIWGVWSILFINFIDFRFYRQFNIMYPWNVLPIEHTKVTYTAALVPIEETVIRSSCLISVLYWIILIGAIYIGLVIISKRRSKKS